MFFWFGTVYVKDDLLQTVWLTLDYNLQVSTIQIQQLSAGLWIYA